MRKRLLVLSALACTTATNVANAQQQGFSLDRFDPSERGSEWFAQDTLDLRGHVRPAIGVVGDWGYKPLVAYAPDGEERTSIVKHQLFAHVGASLVMWERLRLGLNVPIAAFQQGNAATVGGVAYSPADKSALGDVRLGADVRLLGTYGSAFTLAFGTQLFLPTGSREQWTGDEKVRVVPRLQAAGDVGIFAYAARVGAAYRALSEDLAGSKIGSELTFGASAGLRVADRKLLLGPEVFGTTVLSAAFEKKTTPFEVILGAHYTIGDFRVGAGVGPGLTRGFGAPMVRGLLSFEWAPAFVEPVKEPVQKAPVDRDGDGIFDEKDACPDRKGVASDDPKLNGCPDGDNDGIFDAHDACPAVAGVKSDDPKKNGCPPDKDGDGIVDAEDACPEVAGVKSDDPKKNGCPSDRDGDGIVDAEDACPDAPGPKNEDLKKNGCPAAAIVEGQIKILQQVKFKTGSAEILKESDEILGAVAKILADHPEIKKLKVEGHTDNVGGTANNLKLSKARAASVMKWLTTKGKIDKKRLASEGFGESKPIDGNDTEAGRQNNRRVEFKILEQGDAAGATKVEEKPKAGEKPKTGEPPKLPPTVEPAPGPKP
ncbi:MAG: OmpA family protein [Deltaproteobacteria bacterium]|nr:OmpA family protein [Deltaproteobacteria bacterium]